MNDDRKPLLIMEQQPSGRRTVLVKVSDPARLEVCLRALAGNPALDVVVCDPDPFVPMMVPPMPKAQFDHVRDALDRALEAGYPQSRQALLARNRRQHAEIVRLEEQVERLMQQADGMVKDHHRREDEANARIQALRDVLTSAKIRVPLPAAAPIQRFRGKVLGVNASPHGPAFRNVLLGKDDPIPPGDTGVHIVVLDAHGWDLAKAESLQPGQRVRLTVQGYDLLRIERLPDRFVGKVVWAQADEMGSDRWEVLLHRDGAPPTPPCRLTLDRKGPLAHELTDLQPGDHVAIECDGSTLRSLTYVDPRRRLRVVGWISRMGTDAFDLWGPDGRILLSGVVRPWTAGSGPWPQNPPLDDLMRSGRLLGPYGPLDSLVIEDMEAPGPKEHPACEPGVTVHRWRVSFIEGSNRH